MQPEIVDYKTVGDVTLRMHIFPARRGHVPETPSAAAKGDRHMSPDKRPAIVFFFCGGWNGFDAAKMFPQSEYLVSRGMVAFNAEVRVCETHGTTPTECVIDGKSALRWVRAHAAEYGVDPDRIVASGGSAAGHVSACAALIDGFDDPADDLSVSPVPNALVLFNPATNVHGLQRRVEMFGGEERARALSPVLHVRPGAPPTLVMHGSADDVVLPEDAVEFTKVMQAAGNRCELKMYDGAGHGFFNWFDGTNPMFTDTVRDMDIFLASLGYITGEPTIDWFTYGGPGDASASLLGSQP